MKNKKISVVVPFYNAEETLERCLTSIQNQNVKPEEIILLDNNSNDNSKNIVDSFISNFGESKAVYMKCIKQGVSAARNKGASIATGDWLIFTDSDCVTSPNWISDYIDHFDDDRIGAVAGCIKPYPPTNLVQKTLSLFTLPENPHEVVRDNCTFTKGLYPTANLAVKREIFNLVGGFNEALSYGEDHELCRKIYNSGHKIKAAKNAIVEHIHRKSLRKMVKQSFWFGTAHPYELRNFSPGVFIFTSPFIKMNRIKPGTHIWIDLNQADKKFLLLFLLGLMWWPFYSLLLIYVFNLFFFINNKSKKANISTKITELPLLSFLLTLKSFSLTLGRISYSFKHRVLCI